MNEGNFLMLLELFISFLIWLLVIEGLMVIMYISVFKFVIFLLVFFNWLSVFVWGFDVNSIIVFGVILLWWWNMWVVINKVWFIIWCFFIWLVLIIVFINLLIFEEFLNCMVGWLYLLYVIIFVCIFFLEILKVFVKEMINFFCCLKFIVFIFLEVFIRKIMVVFLFNGVEKFK